MALSIYVSLPLLAQATPQMNAGLPYFVANAAPGHENVPRGFHGGGYFEVCSPPIKSRYAGVVWRVLDPVPLPAEVVAKYNGSVMAGAIPPSTFVPAACYPAPRARPASHRVDVPPPCPPTGQSPGLRLTSCARQRARAAKMRPCPTSSLTIHLGLEGSLKVAFRRRR